MGGFPDVGQLSLRLFKLLFPPACALCGRTLQPHRTEAFCADCLSGFRPLPDARCPQCALPFITDSGGAHLCGRCVKHPPPYRKIYAVGLYEQSLRQAVHRFKFTRKVSLDRPLGKLLDRAVDTGLPLDLVVPVPLHRKRLQQRTYNQALLLARELARVRKLPVANNLLLKVRETESQHQLSARERERNLKNAFELRGELHGKRVLLVDDVMTTGATVAACSRVLLDGGAAEVSVAVIGRAASSTRPIAG